MPTSLASISVYLPEGLLPILEAKAAADKRTVSNFIAGLIEAHLKEEGLMPDDQVLMAEVIAAVAEIGPEQALKLLRQSRRKPRRTR